MNKTFIEIQSDLNILQALYDSSTHMMLAKIEVVGVHLESKDSNKSILHVNMLSNEINPYLAEATQHFKKQILEQAIQIAKAKLKQQAIVESSTALAILNAATN